MQDRNGYGNDAFCKALLRGAAAADSSPSARTVTPTSTNVNVTPTGSGLPAAFTACYAPSAVAGNMLCADSDDFWFSGDFTVDLWVKPPPSGNFTVIGQMGAWMIGSDTANYTVWLNSLAADGAWDIATHGTGVPVGYGVWQHLALVGFGNTYALAKNGLWESTPVTSSNRLKNATLGLNVGCSLAYTFPTSGQYCNVRVSKGIARWTPGKSFTPPQRPF